MRRRELEHVLRAACEIAQASEALVIGSQAILGSVTEEVLPPEALASIEVDLAFLEDVAEERADRVDGAIGELSRFHETYGYYAHGVAVTAAVLPAGWRERLILLDTPETAPGRGLCLEPHDLVVSKLVAFREKDRVYAAALLRERFVDAERLLQRAGELDVPDSVRDRLRGWIQAHRS